MAGTEQNGIDILCDAAGSDMLLSSLFSLASPAQSQSHRGQSDRALQQQQSHQDQEQHPPPPPPPKRPSSRSGSAAPTKRKLSDASPSSSSHVCHICRRVYERADHLTRHLRSHENARPYQCSRCPKRFNRADLLTRHETTHDRDGTAKDRPFIRRSDRAAEACLNCASSKAKCEDQKPCSRCRSKNLHCQMPTRRGNQYRTSDSQAGMSPSEASTMASVVGMDAQGFQLADPGYATKSSTLAHASNSHSHGGYEGSAFHGHSSLDGFADDVIYFNNNPIQSIFQDMDFTLDLDFDGFAIPQLDVTGPSPKSTSTPNSKRSSSHHATRDVSRGHAAFKRSPWIWEPDMVKDYVHRETAALNLNDESLPASSTLQRFANNTKTKLQIPSASRDRLFAMVLAHNPHPQRVPSFPSLELLNYLLQAHFVQEERKCDALIHKPSFDPATTIPELLGAVISSGATYISVSSIWQFGLALDEMVRYAIAGRIEGSNVATRDLMTLQALMLHLDIGQWCGFNRKMEIAESFCQPILTMLRRSGKTTFSSDSPSQMPSMTDSPDVLDSKWRQFIIVESYKRLVIHIFFHDIQSSIGLCKNPLMSYNELCFTLPASRDLWKARSAEEWRDLYLVKPYPHGGIPRVAEVTQCMTILDELEARIDIELSSTALLHGFWGQISSYRDAVRFYSNGGSNRRGASTPPLWLKTQHQELYRDIAEFANQIQHSQKPKPQLMMLAELFMMILHVSPDDLHRFAGKYGEDEARRVSQPLDVWFAAPESRYAVWHAGQLFHWARKLAPTSLRDFNAIAVYFACLTLWAYGVVSCSHSTNGRAVEKKGHGSSPDYVLVDGTESRETRAFLQLDRGVPALTMSGDAGSSVQSLSNAGMVLVIARNLLRDNYPVQEEPLPPLVESLARLLRDLGSGVTGRASRVPSEGLPETTEHSP